MHTQEVLQPSTSFHEARPGVAIAGAALSFRARRGGGLFGGRATCHIRCMNGFLGVLLGLAMIGVVASLFIGLFGMARGGDFNARHGNRMMRFRVIFQGFALALIALALLMGGRS